MYTMHNINQRVLDTTDLEMFTMLTVMIEHYHCHSMFEPHYYFYREQLYEDGLPSEYGRDLIMWLYISHVYDDMHENFQQLTRVAVRETRDDEPIDTLGFFHPTVGGM
ncbi:hypothetical protein K491DRAFT_359489 [Lophiostoma macrostomum CBS 122681]|uniref:Uncharacterized protein n=1 Tax=Lophiostoma macrostomum CBS 122681 TaxID=1314788 RepID=A0A6A6TCZ1_9PLEO|nr:hypothetical protein K491DRAFT_359489 [Lophiostoma macrostomum CBS 122681]